MVPDHGQDLVVPGDHQHALGRFPKHGTLRAHAGQHRVRIGDQRRIVEEVDVGDGRRAVDHDALLGRPLRRRRARSPKNDQT